MLANATTGYFLLDYRQVFFCAVQTLLKSMFYRLKSMNILKVCSIR